MKKTGKMRITAIALTAAMLFGLTGCGASDKTPQGSSAEESKTSVSASTAQESETKTEETTQITYPLDTKDTLSVWTSNGTVRVSSVYTDYTQSPFHQGLAKNTGVDVEWIYPPQGTDATQAYNLLLTEEDLPDIIYYGIDASAAQTLIEDGIIYDLTEYIPKYAPDYWATINQPEYEQVLRSVKTDDGRLYGVEQFVEGDYNVTYVGPVVRKDWLDECGLDMPVTLEDWENVLVTFKEKYNAALGFSMGRMNSGGLESGTGAYASFTSRLFVDDNGKIQLAQCQPEWKEYIEILNKWYDMGLIDKDSVSMDDAAMRTKALNNEVGISVTAISQLSNWVTDAQAEGSSAEWVGLSYPRTAAGAPTCMIHTRASYNIGFCGMVTTACSEEKLITALEWLNYGFTKEGRMYWNYGTEGESYYLDENGVPQWTDLILNDPDGLSEAVFKYAGTSSTGLSVQESQLVRLRNTPAAQEAVYIWIDNTEAGKHTVPRICMTTEESQAYSDKMTAINTYVQEMALKFFVGEESLDKYDAFVDTLYSMGLQDCLDLQQAAYDRYMAR